jgi:hypothetical protein
VKDLAVVSVAFDEDGTHIQIGWEDVELSPQALLIAANTFLEALPPDVREVVLERARELP